jgi:hypothetical protein
MSDKTIEGYHILKQTVRSDPLYVCFKGLCVQRQSLFFMSRAEIIMIGALEF